MKKKGLIAIFSACITLIVALIATIVVLASGTQGIGTNVSVLYVATDIEGEVSATYSRVNKNTKAVISTTDMVTSSGAKKVSFLASQPTTTSLLNPTESNIALTAEQDLIITYTFTTIESYYATLNYVDNSGVENNFIMTYSLNGADYVESVDMPIEVNSSASTSFAIKLSIANTAKNANLNGSFNWALSKSGAYESEGTDKVALTFVNNEGSAVSENNVKVVVKDGKFKIVGPTPVLNSLTTNSFTNGLFNERDLLTATGKISSITDLTNGNSAEFYYFCTNSAVTGGLTYVDPENVYFTSTSDSSLETWYDIPEEKTTLYSCFMTPNCFTEKYSGNETQIIISNSVTRLAEQAFAWKSSIDKVVIPQSITVVGKSSFSGCRQLGSIILPSSVETVENLAFNGYCGLTDIVFGSKLKRVGLGAFSECTSITRIELPKTIEVIEQYAFRSCINLEVISVEDGGLFYKSKDNCLIEIATNNLMYGCKNSIIPDGVVKIGDYAFYQNAPEDLVIPEGVTEIGNNAFSSSKVVNISLPTTLCVIGNNAFQNCNNIDYTISNSIKYIGGSSNPYLFASGVNDKTLITYTLNGQTKFLEGTFNGCSKLETITLPIGLQSVGASTFYGCSALMSINLPSTVKSLGEYSFYNSGLTSVEIPNGMVLIGDYSFASCTSLTRAVISESVSNIGSSVFYRCSALESVQINTSLINLLPGYIFSGCTSLKSMNIPSTISEIGNCAFNGCSALESVSLSASLEKIGENAFEGAINISNIIVDNGNEFFYAEGNCLVEKSTKTLIMGTNFSTIPSGVLIIGKNAFNGCTGLSDITLPNSVVTLEEGAFRGCTGLSNVTIPSSVITLGESVFRECSGLINIVIPNSVTTIGSSAFSDCTSLNNVSIGNGVTSIGHYAFSSCTALTSIEFVDTTSSWKLSTGLVISITDPSQNATYLVTTYIRYAWTKNS